MKHLRRSIPTGALAALAMLSLGATLALFGGVLFRIATNAHGATGDFISFYAAGYLVRTGHGSELYQPEAMRLWQHLLYPGTFDEAIGYPLPVFVAWGFAPISLLPFTTGFLVYMAGMAAVLLGLLWAVRHELDEVPPWPRRLFIVAAACSLPALTAIGFGQVDLLALSGLFGGYFLLRARRPGLAGGALCMVLVKPHLLAGVGLYLLVRREWRTLGALALLGLPLLVLPAALTGSSLLLDNIKVLASYPGSDQGLSVNSAVMPNWRGLVVSATDREVALWWLPGFVAIAGTSAGAALHRWRQRETTFDQSYALAVTLPLLLSPHLHTQSLVLLLLPATLAFRAWWQAAPETARLPGAVNVVLVSYSLLFLLPVLAILGLSLTVFVVLAAYGWMVVAWPARGELATFERERKPLATAA